MDEQTERFHCMAIRHEFMRCRDAYELFNKVGFNLVSQGHTNQKGYMAYNAYADFILHLYELQLALFSYAHKVPDISNALQSKARKEKKRVCDYTDLMITEEVRRLAQRAIDDADSSEHPLIDHDRALFESILPPDPNFAEAFRKVRNKIAGHVSYERIQEVNLTNFYHRYHFYLYVLYLGISEAWEHRLDKTPEFGEVTDFLKAIAKGTQPRIERDI